MDKMTDEEREALNKRNQKIMAEYKQAKEERNSSRMLEIKLENPELFRRVY